MRSGAERSGAERDFFGGGAEWSGKARGAERSGRKTRLERSGAAVFGALQFPGCRGCIVPVHSIYTRIVRSISFEDSRLRVSTS